MKRFTTRWNSPERSIACCLVGALWSGFIGVFAGVVIAGAIEPTRPTVPEFDGATDCYLWVDHLITDTYFGKPEGFLEYWCGPQDIPFN